MTKATNWMRSPDRDRSFEVASKIRATTPKNNAMQMNICTNFSVEDMKNPLLSGGHPHPDGRGRPGEGCASSAVGQDDGQDFSMLSRASCVLSPVIQAVISFQKELAPTSPGIWSEPSKRKTASGSWKICADSWSIGLTRLATSRPVLALTQPPPGVALAFSLAHTSVDR